MGLNRADESDEKGREEKSNTTFFSIRQVNKDLKRAFIGGGLAAAFTLAGAMTVGFASGGEAYQLLQTALPAVRSFCGTVILAMGNILALMLTLISLSASTDIDLKWSHYHRVQQIAWADTVTLIGAILIYLLLNIPLNESEPPSIAWFTGFYYATLVLSSILGGAIITIILMLFSAVKDLIHVIGPSDADSDQFNRDIINEDSD